VEGRRYAVIVLALSGISLILGCTLNPGIQLTGNLHGDIPRSYQWRYEGKTYSWKVSIPSSLYRHYRSLPRRGDYGDYVADPGDDKYLKQLCSELSEADVRTGWSGKVDFVLSFVQSLKYSNDSITGFDEYPRYPIETLVDGGGDCEDTAILFVSILRELGYGAVLLRFDKAHHMAAGVRISEEVVERWPKDYPLTYYRSDGKIYAYCETTGSGWQIGEKPEWIGDEGAVVIGT